MSSLAGNQLSSFCKSSSNYHHAFSLLDCLQATPCQFYNILCILRTKPSMSSLAANRMICFSFNCYSQTCKFKVFNNKVMNVTLQFNSDVFNTVMLLWSSVIKLSFLLIVFYNVQCLLVEYRYKQGERKTLTILSVYFLNHIFFFFFFFFGFYR